MTIQEFRDYMASAETMSTKVKSDTTMIRQTNMEYVKLGNSDLRVSRICLGCK